MRMRLFFLVFVPVLLSGVARPALFLASKDALPYSPVAVSRNGRYYGEVTYSDALEVERFILRANDGRVLWEMEDPPYQTYRINDDGSCVVGYRLYDEMGSSGELGFFDQNGNLLSTATVQYMQGSSFSLDGGLFGANTSSGLLIFDRNGTQLRSLPSCNHFAIGGRDRVTVTVREEIVRGHCGADELYATTIGTPFVRSAALSPSGEIVGIITKQDIYLLKTEDGELLRKITLDKASMQFLSFAVGQSIVSAVVAAGDNSKSLMVWDLEGELLGTIELQLGNVVPVVNVLADGRIVSLRANEEVWQFRFTK